MSFRDMGYTRVKTTTDEMHVVESYDDVLVAIAEARRGSTPTGLVEVTEVVLDWGARFSALATGEETREPVDTQRRVSFAPSTVESVVPSEKVADAVASSTASNGA